MFEQVLPGNTKKYLALLGEKGILPEETYLSGGTAIALHLGHRISKDLDFFTTKEFGLEKVLKDLKDVEGFTLTRQDWGTILGTLPTCKFSLFYYQYPLLEPSDEYLKIQVAGLRDLAASKIGAISSRGTKRDFVDIYYLLKNGAVGNLADFLSYYDQRFKNLATQKIHILKSLDYFADADQDEDPQMLVDDYSWKEVKEFLEDETKKII